MIGESSATRQNRLNAGYLEVCERWYILLVFGFLTSAQCFIWNAYGPITDVVEHIFQWGDANIALLNNWGPIMFLVVAPALALFVDRYGLRYGVLVSAVFVFMASVTRCIYVPNSVIANTLIQNTAAIFNAMGGPLFWGAPTTVSALWFPASQRMLATSVAVNLGTMGNALAFVLEPAFVQNPFSHNDSNITSSTPQGNPDAEAAKVAQEQLFTLFYVTCGIMLALLICVLVHFPARPKSAPSTSATEQREPFWAGVRKLARSRSFWLLSSYAVVVGIAISWISIIYIVLRPLHTHTELQAGLLGFITNIVQMVLGLIFAKFADSYIHHSKRLLIVTLTASAFLYGWFGLMANNFIPMNVLILDFCVVVPSSIVTAMLPVYLELANEICYPVNESLCSLALASVNQVVCVIFYFAVSAITMASNSGVDSSLANEWLFWVPLVVTIIGVVPLFFLRERFNRVRVDRIINGDTYESADDPRSRLLENSDADMDAEANADDSPIRIGKDGRRAADSSETDDFANVRINESVYSPLPSASSSLASTNSAVKLRKTNYD